MDPLLVGIIVAVVVILIVLMIVRPETVKGLNLGSLQTILILLVLIFLVIWLGRMVLGG